MCPVPISPLINIPPILNVISTANNIGIYGLVSSISDISSLPNNGYKNHSGKITIGNEINAVEMRFIFVVFKLRSY